MLTRLLFRTSSGSAQRTPTTLPVFPLSPLSAELASAPRCHPRPRGEPILQSRRVRHLAHSLRRHALVQLVYFFMPGILSRRHLSLDSVFFRFCIQVEIKMTPTYFETKVISLLPLLKICERWATRLFILPSVDRVILPSVDRVNCARGR